MTDLRKAAEMALEALMQKGEHHPKVYRAAEALRQALAQSEHETAKYKEECWACGCEECICATKVPGYYESKIKEAVLAEREACAKLLEDAAFRGTIISCTSAAKAIRARGEK